MTVWQLVGYGILTAILGGVYLAIFIQMVKSGGWALAILSFGAVFTVLGLIYLGVNLALGVWP